MNKESISTFFTEQFSNIKVFAATIIILILFSVFTLVGIKSASNTLYMVFPLFSGDLFDLSPDTYFYYITTMSIQVLIVLASGIIAYTLYAIFHSIFAYYAYKSLAKEYLYNEIELKNIIIKGVSWKFYRSKYILLPLIISFSALASLFLVGFLSFNTLTAIAGYSIGLVTFLSIFAFLTSLTAFVFSFFMTAWNFFASSLGFEIAITEPFLSNATIKERSERLVFAKKNNALLYLLTSLFYILIAVQLYKAITPMNFISMQNTYIIFVTLGVDLLLFYLLKYVNVSMYIDSLLTHYDNITINKHYYYQLLKGTS